MKRRISLENLISEVREDRQKALKFKGSKEI